MDLRMCLVLATSGHSSMEKMMLRRCPIFSNETNSLCLPLAQLLVEPCLGFGYALKRLCKKFILCLQVWSSLPPCDILVTHGPPLGLTRTLNLNKSKIDQVLGTSEALGQGWDVQNFSGRWSTPSNQPFTSTDTFTRWLFFILLTNLP